MIPDDPSLFERLKRACAPEWDRYVDHPFVRGLGDGTLPVACFRHYLGQDYLFLSQFARAYGLAVYKSETPGDIRRAADGLAAILGETRLHVAYCHPWGLTEEDLARLDEEPATIAYSRFVLDRGMAGDLLDLDVALAPCIVGYAEIGRRLAALPGGDNPYRAWIEAYGGDAYQEASAAHVAQIDRVMAARGGEGRLPALIDVFRRATMLEADFWEAGLKAAG